MTAKYWIKLYIEIMDDPKMATLPDRLWRRIIELFMCAGRLGDDGNIPDVHQLAWLLRMDSDDLLLDLRQIATTGIIQQTEMGWIVTKFAERQRSVSVNERVKQFRDRQKKQQYYGDVTELKRDVTQINRLTDSESDTEKIGAAISSFHSHSEYDASKLYSDITGQMAIPSTEADAAIANLVAVIDSYGNLSGQVIEDGKRIFSKWCTTKGKNGRTYSKTNPGWLTWWLDELAPSPGEAYKPIDLPKPAVLCGDGETYYRRAKSNNSLLDEYRQHISSCRICSGASNASEVSVAINKLTQSMRVK